MIIKEAIDRCLAACEGRGYEAYIKATRNVLFPFEQREMFGKVHYVDNVADKNLLMWKLIEEFEAEHPDFEPLEYQLIISYRVS